MSYYRVACEACSGKDCTKCRGKGYLLWATNADEKITSYFTGRIKP